MITHIYLVVSILMAGDIPDRKDSLEMPTIEACWDAAADFVRQPLPRVEDVVGLGASCSVVMEGRDP